MVNYYLEIIESKARAVIQQYLDTPPDGIHWWESIKSYIKDVSGEYYERLLVELIQNGCDALSRGTTNGEVHIHYDSNEGEHGVLYVANQGRPFDKDNFNAINTPGYSNKKPGEGIGHKGIGFRSVLQVCDWPEIYSADRESNCSDQFTGFCFGYAKQEDVIRLLGDNAEKSNQVSNDLIYNFLPVPLSTQNDTLREFAKKGMATVVRLPIKTERAAESVQKQIAEIRSEKLPLLLFLPRVNRLDIKTGGTYSDGDTLALTKEPVLLQLQGTSDNLKLENVELGELGSYIVAHMRVDPSRLRVGLEESVREGFIDERWLKWSEEAWVSVACRIDTDSEEHRCYTFFPMQASSPFAGHLNAPFFTKFARTELNEEIPLNSLLLDVAAELCAEAIHSLRDFGSESTRKAMVDLLTWDDDHKNRIEAAFNRIGENIKEALVIPILPRRSGESLGNIKEVSRWNDENLKCLTTKNLVLATEVQLVPSELGEERIQRLDKFCRNWFPEGIEPNTDSIAHWSEDIAGHLLKKRVSLSRWNDFYDDLEHLFKHEGSALNGRKILLDDDLHLQTAGWDTEEKDKKRRTTVFFPPARELAEDEEDFDAAVELRIPRNLKRHICFMHAGLTWLIEEDQTPGRKRRKPSRTFLQQERLVRTFRSRDLLDHVTRVISDNKSRKVNEDALRWAYNLFTAVGNNLELDFRRVPFKVPCLNEWIPAENALFSEKWQKEYGRDLERLIKEASTVSNEITLLRQRLLMSPEEWPFRIVNVSGWLDFLQRIGVRSGLWPVPLGQANLQRRGDGFSPNTLTKALGLEELDTTRWNRAVESHNDFPNAPLTQYHVEGHFAGLPGQSEQQRFTYSAKSLYAMLIVRGLAEWDERHFFAQIRPALGSSAKDRPKWPTPLTAFLMDAPWIAQTRVGDRQSNDFVSIRNAWNISDEEESPPPYSPLIPRELRRNLAVNSTARKRYKILGGRNWSDPTDAAALVCHLTRVFLDIGIAEHHLADFRRAYNHAWNNCLRQDNPFPLNKSDDLLPLVVSKGTRLEVVYPADHNRSDGDSIIFAGVGYDLLVSHILETLGRPILDLTGTFEHDPEISKKQEQQLIAILEERFGLQVRALSKVTIDVLVDDEPFEPDIVDPLLIQGEIEWLGELVRLILELKGENRGALSAVTLQIVDSRLRRIRIRRCRSIGLRIDETEAQIPNYLGGVIEIDNTQPTIIVRGEDREPEGRWFMRLAQSIGNLIGHRSICDPLELSLSKLAAKKTDESFRQFTDENFAEALSAPIERVREIRRGYQGRLATILELLRPIVAHFAGLNAAATYVKENGDLTDERAIIAALEGMETSLPVQSKTLIDHCTNAASLADLREVLGIDYAGFNQTLAELGPPYTPIHNEEGHRQALAHFITRQRINILNSLRQGFIATFDARKSLDQYIDLREFRGLEPDPAWLNICDFPSDEMMITWVDEWLTGKGAQALGKNTEGLPPYEETRQKNREQFAELYRKLAKIIPAWCSAYHCDTPPAWRYESGGRDKLIQECEGSGFLDFRSLEDSELIRWFKDNGHWPNGMESSIDLSVLGLTEKDLTAQEREAEREGERREFERNSVMIGEKQLSLDRDGAREIADGVISNLTEGFLSSSTRLSKLNPIFTKSGRKSSSTGGGKQSRGRPTEKLKETIGFIGEVVAYQWLRQNYTITPESWKSRNRIKLYGGDLGNDSLGYDFEVNLKSITLMFEVKSTVTEIMEIELGQTEVICAQRNAGQRESYRILFISDVLDVKRRRLYVLPNPFGHRGRDFYQIAGSGLRYRFQITG